MILIDDDNCEKVEQKWEKENSFITKQLQGVESTVKFTRSLGERFIFRYLDRLNAF